MMTHVAVVGHNVRSHDGCADVVCTSLQDRQTGSASLMTVEMEARCSNCTYKLGEGYASGCHLCIEHCQQAGGRSGRKRTAHDVQDKDAAEPGGVVKGLVYGVQKLVATNKATVTLARADVSSWVTDQAQGAARAKGGNTSFIQQKGALVQATTPRHFVSEEEKNHVEAEEAGMQAVLRRAEQERKAIELRQRRQQKAALQQKASEVKQTEANEFEALARARLEAGHQFDFTEPRHHVDASKEEAVAAAKMRDQPEEKSMQEGNAAASREQQPVPTLEKLQQKYNALQQLANGEEPVVHVSDSDKEEDEAAQLKEVSKDAAQDAVSTAAPQVS